MRLPKRARTFRRSAATPPQTPHAAAQTVAKPPITPPQGSTTTTESPMKGGAVDPETEDPPMESSPPATQTVHRSPAHVIERRLDELDACVAKALTSRPRRPGVDGSLVADIQGKTDFLRMVIAAEKKSQGDARPEHLVEIEWRFGVLERTIEQWAQGVVAAPAEEEEEPAREAAGSVSGSDSGSGSGSGSGGCSCTGSCSGFEVTGKEAALDAKCNLDQVDAEAHKDAAAAAAAPAVAAIEVPPATRPAVRRRWWKRRAALCGAAGVVAVIALGAGLALEFAAVAQQSDYVVPT